MHQWQPSCDSYHFGEPLQHALSTKLSRPLQPPLCTLQTSYSEPPALHAAEGTSHWLGPSTGCTPLYVLLSCRTFALVGTSGLCAWCWKAFVIVRESGAEALHSAPDVMYRHLFLFLQGSKLSRSVWTATQSQPAQELLTGLLRR